MLVNGDGDHGLEVIQEHQEALETLAESDLRSAKWARALLNALDAEGST